MQRLRGVALAALLVQGILLFWNLGMLPLWGDEYFSLRAVEQPLSGMFETLRNDMHPPLYFLAAHYWLKLPLADDPIVRLRMLSALLTLIGSAVMLWFALPRLSPRGALWFCALLATSPCLILYGRIIRSYGLQLIVVPLAIHQLLKLLDRPTKTRATMLGLAAALVLYTHYLPGVALIAAINIALLLRHRSLTPLVLPNAVMLIAYSPWLITLAAAASKWGTKLDSYQTGGPALSVILQLGYGGVSFLFGENVAWWMFLFEIPLAAGLLWLAWKGTARARAWLFPIVIIAIVGYAGVIRYVSYPFLPGRLIFLVPFLLLLLAQGVDAKPLAGRILLTTMLATSALGLWFYFHVENFLNWGYAIPFPQIAREMASENKPTVAAALLTDSEALSYYLPPSILYRQVSANPEQAAAELASNWQRVAVVRQTHDSSPNDFYRRFDAALAAKLPVRKTHQYLPLARFDQIMMRALGWPEASHFYEMIEFSRD